MIGDLLHVLSHRGVIIFTRILAQDGYDILLPRQIRRFVESILESMGMLVDLGSAFSAHVQRYLVPISATHPDCVYESAVLLICPEKSRPTPFLHKGIVGL